MNRNRDNRPKSPFPVSPPGNTSESFDEFLLRMQTLLEGDDENAFFDAIENVPSRWRLKPEFMLVKSLGFLRSGDIEMGREVLDEIEKSHPRFGPLYFYKAGLYMADAFPAHVIRVVEKLHSFGRMDDEAEGELAEMETISRQMLKESAGELGVSYEKMEKASWHHEAAQEKMNTGQWSSAEQMAREALRQIPGWSSPRNNHSYVLYFMGKVEDAIAEAQTVLAQDPKNLHALKNLVIFYAGLDEQEKAREFSTRMAEHIETLPADAEEMDTIISVLGLVEDDATLWKLAQKYLKRDYADLLDMSWHVLGIAAVRSGHLKEARTLLEKIDPYYEPAQSLVNEVRKTLKSRGQFPSPPQYSVLGLLLPAIVIEQLIDMIGKHPDEEQLPRHIQKKLDEYIQARPFVANGLFHMLGMPGGSEAVPNLLLHFNNPDVDARLLAFALGDVGTSQQRLNILSAMSQAGRELPPSPIRFWSEERGEWTEVDFFAQMLSDDFDVNISPEAAAWVQKAHEAEDVQEKISLWRKAVEADPKSGYAVHMLGILLIQNGQKEEGKKLAQRAIEVDPEYMFAYANLAMMEAQEETPNVDLAMEYINKVSKAPIITTQTAFIMHFALMMLAFDREDFETARMEYEIAADLRSDDPLLEGWDVRLKLGEVFAGGWLAKWQKESHERAHNKAMRTKLDSNSSVHVTLNSLNRDVLGSVARVWGVTTYGKKAELIARIVEEMQNIEAFKWVWMDLNPTEQTAARWVLENDGVRGWNEFIEKYGDDSDESPYWNYHEPGSVIGRLRRAGFLAKGTLDDEQVVFMPVEVRSSLNTLQ